VGYTIEHLAAGKRSRKAMIVFSKSQGPELWAIFASTSRRWLRRIPASKGRPGKSAILILSKKEASGTQSAGLQEWD